MHIAICQSQQCVETRHHVTYIHKCADRVPVENISFIMAGVIYQNDSTPLCFHTDDLMIRCVAAFVVV
ncbi:hypothetical protein A0U92_05810 [Acetobacter aceti]|uniref:Uncharacterized protein n=1 Tax=Acetobacter aceti TaxID=435 RepID=A0A1U9KF70_ACEAC|nr:hypothetical protein A0U92_05810 [Acetobacter aceti]